MKILKIIFLISIIPFIFSCSSSKNENISKNANIRKSAAIDRYAVIYFEIYDRSECNGDITGIINDGEFFLLIERDNITTEKIIIPVNFSSEFKRDKGFLRVPIKWNAVTPDRNPKFLILNLMDDDGINPQISKLIAKAETVGGIMLMSEKGFFIFKNALEVFSGKPWDEYINQDILKLGSTQPCGNVSYRIPANPPKNLDEANYLSFIDGDKLKMKIKIYFEEIKK